MREILTMSSRERKRLEVMSRVATGSVTLAKASEILGVSYRQTKRIAARYKTDGDAGLIHRLRGKPSNRGGDRELRERVVARYAEEFSDYGPTLAAEELKKENVQVPTETLRRWLTQAGLWSRHRRRKEHRRKRDRRAKFGELVQMDGSYHDWFEGRRDWAVLMVMIDDATGRVFASFFEAETQAAAFEMTHRYATKHGLPGAIYVDRASIYRSEREPTNDEILAEKEPVTDYGRAMETLGIELILARSPQAKGRVERMNATLQDRLVKAMRRKKISSLEEANRFLEAEFLGPFNERFEKAPRDASDGHRALAQEIDLFRILAPHEVRVVQNDWTVRWNNAFLQLGRDAKVQPGDRVTVIEQRDGRVRLFVGDRELSYGTTRTEPSPTTRKAKTSSPGPTKSNQGRRPAANHPWRGSRRWRVVFLPRRVRRSPGVRFTPLRSRALPSLRKPHPRR